MTTRTVEDQIVLADKLKGKMVVIDTSSLLMAGTGMLKVLNNCSLVIPSIVVQELEEKRTHTTIGFLAREWLRLIENLRVKYGKELSVGVALEGYEGLTLQIEPNHRNRECLPEHLKKIDSHDTTILSVTKNLSNERGGNVVLMSNDVPMRIYSTLDLDIEAVEFSASAIVPAKPFDGTMELVLSDEEYADLVETGTGTKFDKKVLSFLPEDRAQNVYVNIVSDTGVSLANVLVSGDEVAELQRKHRSSEIVARTVEQDIAMHYLKLPYDDVSIVSLQGKAGSGKTLVTIAAGLEELRKGRYQKIIVFRSLHEMGNGQEMGFLPGDVGEKMGAWAGAIYDAIDVIASSKKTVKKKNEGPHADTALKAEVDKLKGMVEISPITYLRGRSLANSYLVLEEAQNFSRSEILNILSRAGEGSKIVFTFDDMQVDNKFLQAGNKADIWSVIESLKKEKIFAHISLKRTERSKVAEIASRIIEEQH